MTRRGLLRMLCGMGAGVAAARGVAPVAAGDHWAYPPAAPGVKLAPGPWYRCEVRWGKIREEREGGWEARQAWWWSGTKPTEGEAFADALRKLNEEARKRGLG